MTVGSPQLAPVHGFNLRRVLLFDQFAFELHGGREFLVFGAELGFQQEELLDLFDAGKFFVDAVQFSLDQVLHFFGTCQALVIGERHVVVLRKLLHVFLVNHDDDRQVGALVANDDRVGDIG